MSKNKCYLIRVFLVSWLFVVLPSMSVANEAELSGGHDLVGTQRSVNINAADAQFLADSLRGVGLKRAQDIVAWRESYGPFTSVEQLQEVKGIGVKVLSENSHLLVVE